MDWQSCISPSGFVGEDSILPGGGCCEDTHLYFPKTWKDWSPGLQQRVEWAWKHYTFNAVTTLQKTPIQYAKHLVGRGILHLIFNGNLYQKKYWKSYDSLFSKLARDYSKDLDTGKEIKLVWGIR